MAARWIRHTPGGLTLIELLVVIVILVTLVAGVIPLLSPNNDARKIREASRGLQVYINATQAEAARTGRPHGIGFVESPSGNGMALEVFRMEVPQAFAGFSDASRVVVRQITNALYGPNGNKGTQFLPRYLDYPLYDLQFVQTGGAATLSPDQLPPRMFRIGDLIDVDGNQFLIVDDDDRKAAPNSLETFPPNTPGAMQYLQAPKDLAQPQFVQCIWINYHGQQLPLRLPSLPPVTKPYRIIRQPVPSSASPFVFPAGIAIDMQGSVVEGGATAGFPIPGSFDDSRPSATQLDLATIMFSPSGTVSSVNLNGNTIENISRIALLLGRVENGNLIFVPTTANAYADVTDGAWIVQNGTPEAIRRELEQKQNEVNWLNLDSRWLMITTRSGRAIVSENAFVNAGNFAGDTPVQQAIAQIEAAHDIARGMKRGGGR